jgi:hypothetical protein
VVVTKTTTKKLSLRRKRNNFLKLIFLKIPNSTIAVGVWNLYFWAILFLL